MTLVSIGAGSNRVSSIAPKADSGHANSVSVYSRMYSRKELFQGRSYQLNDYDPIAATQPER